MAYIAGLIARLRRDYPVDPERVYVGGFSMGAVMAGRIACQQADLVAGILMDAGDDWQGTCAPLRPVSVFAMHGTADSTLPIGGVRRFVDGWRQFDQCADALHEEALTSTASAQTSGDCAAGSAVTFVTVQGGTHQYFTDPDALETGWEFLTTYRRTL